MSRGRKSRQQQQRTKSDNPASKPEGTLPTAEPDSPPVKSETVKTTITADEYAKIVQNRIKIRFWQTLDVLTNYAKFVVTYLGAVLSDVIIFAVVWHFLNADVNKYLVLSKGVGFAKVGIGLIAAAGALIHGGFSAYQQFLLDKEAMKEGSNEGH